MMKRRLLISFLLVKMIFLLDQMLYAQSIMPQSLNSAGASMSQSNGSISFTLGEVLILTQRDSLGNTLSSGFSSDGILTTSIVKDTDINILNVKVFPNPTSDIVNVEIIYSSIDKLIIEITDIKGRNIYIDNCVTTEKAIRVNTFNYPPGTYIMLLKDINNNVLGSYTIIKQ
jgi:hypothetical protein